MKARLNLATQALETHRRFLAGAWLIGFFALLIFLILGWHVNAARKAQAAIRSRTSQLQSEFVVLRKQSDDLEHYFQQPKIAELSDRAAFINTIIDERSFNWTQMFMDLEHVLPNGVRVVRIEPGLVKGDMQVKLTVGASSDEAKVKFLRALESSKVFTNIMLLDEHAPTGASAGDQMQVDLQVTYSRT
jgi:Tfp pilus assembly protein PilN